MAFCGPKRWVNPFGKFPIIRLFELLVFKAQKGFFFVLEYRERHFSCLYCLKKEFGKMAIFVPRRWVNPLGKMSIFRLFKLFVFVAQKGVFSFQNIVKDILQSRKEFFRCKISKRTFSWAILPKKKKFEKWPFFEQNHGLTPLEKCQFFDFLNFLFLQPRKAFFRSRIS